MQPNDHKIRNYDLILDETFGKQGTPERAKAEEEFGTDFAECQQEARIFTPPQPQFSHRAVPSACSNRCLQVKSASTSPATLAGSFCF